MSNWMLRPTAWLGALFLVGIGCGGNAELPIPAEGQGGFSGVSDGGGGASGTSYIGNTDASSGTGGAVTQNTDAGPQCGNGVVEQGEECDDGNLVPGDGCSGVCKRQRGYSCPPDGGTCWIDADALLTDDVSTCGDGVVQGTEACDLGAAQNDGQHGCTAGCFIVAGWTCPDDGGACTAYCGDGVLETTQSEECDLGAGNNDGTKGCSAACKIVKGWACPTGTSCQVDTKCGDGVVDTSTGETCDDHNLRSYDGCSSTCRIESGFTCPSTGGACTRICGNSVIDTASGETCDDGNYYSGDGCSSKCTIEKDYTCPEVGKPCVYSPTVTAVCGDGKVTAPETCDDSNVVAGDGCGVTCQTESGWTCPAAGGACSATSCGDGIVAGTEACDDGNTVANDGCTNCAIDTGAVCLTPTGGACTAMKCGDGKVTGTEKCDPGSVPDGKHGCSADCQTITTGWECPVAGTACISICGDGIVVGTEECDEGAAGADCCTTSCTLVDGKVCDPNATPHSQDAFKYCGNGTVDGPSNAARTVYGAEQCDDGNKIPFDGCSADCKNEPLCGTVNTYVTPEPAATSFQCFAHCGDGLVMTGQGEECDDGNTADGDGCSSSCKIETSAVGKATWTCSQPDLSTSKSITLPVIWRDFTPKTHPQFDVNPGTASTGGTSYAGRFPHIATTALAQVALSSGLQHKYKYLPLYNTAYTYTAGGTAYIGWTMNGPGWVSGYDAAPLQGTAAATLSVSNANTLLTMGGRYAQWYADDQTPSITSAAMRYVGQIELAYLGADAGASAGAYQFSCEDTTCGTMKLTGMTTSDSSTPTKLNPSGGFFPLDGLGWVAAGSETAQSGQGGTHNFSFTTETRTWFIYQGGERLDFYGDDDVWVFVNGTLVLDIGGIHGKIAGYFTLGGGDATSYTGTTLDTSIGTNGVISLGLEVGKVYEIAVFNAERHITQSNFQLTMKGFNGSPSSCNPICGDGVVVGNEQCDRGADNVGADAGTTYGKCTTACKLGPYCGDGLIDTADGEACDNGLNLTPYVKSLTANPSACYAKLNATTGIYQCVKPAYCGDGNIDTAYGETCDNGAANADEYGKCQTNCTWGARCGDGVKQGTEECDDGDKNGAASSSCDANCKTKCGNGTIDTGEQCDDGAKNGTSASTCDSSCKNKCGNGSIEAGEVCDDGVNDGTYGTCMPGCTALAPYCGDGTPQTIYGEVCDLGTANSDNAYGANSCTTQCLPGGSCGDGIIQSPEKCDDGHNTGLPGSCTADCSAYVTSAACGDGTVGSSEQCDDGSAVNGTAASKCDSTCRWKCGNGVLDTGETCDDGVNDGSYGGCTTTCQRAGYCGDGIKNGTEACDNGTANVSPSSAGAYGQNICLTDCTWAPFCGDGRIQATFGEQCEGTSQCDNCKSTGGGIAK